MKITNYAVMLILMILTDKVSAITPVPGGIGLMTITMLMKNTIEAFYHRNGD